ncbi:thioredoxin family protein [Metabacillus sp. Hm71]|uniref:thioredoxin family protein n=1 Tax=Metabacillus sp. Hm71 TaxID=3450743 RepID=UPI003F4376DA
MANKLIKFEKENCPNCDRVQMFLDNEEVEVQKVNPFENPTLAARYDIGSVPTTVLVDEDGNEIDKSISFNPGELEELISKL